MKKILFVFFIIFGFSKDIWCQALTEQQVIQSIGGYIKLGQWNYLLPYFESKDIYDSLLSSLAYSEKDKNCKYCQSISGKPSLIARMKPYSIDNILGNQIIIKNELEKNLTQLNFELKNLGGKYYISAVDVNKKKSNNRIPATTEFKFARLPNATFDIPEYFHSMGEYYGKTSISIGKSNEEISFRQINFKDLDLEFKWCKKVLGIKICGTESKKFVFGPVLSGEDIPDNTQENWNTDQSQKMFGHITDMTAFINELESNPGYLRNKFVLTAVVTDDEFEQITFIREGQNPLQYGAGVGDLRFYNPVAVHAIGDYIYVLERGAVGGFPPCIKVLKIVYDIEGEFRIETIGTSILNLGFDINTPSDIGGCKSDGFSPYNLLWLSDKKGLHKININPSTGLCSSVEHFETAVDPLDLKSERYLYDIKRIDASSQSGYTVAINSYNEVFSFPTRLGQLNNGKISITNNNYLPSYFNPNNLAYMVNEEKWYLTDETGKLHTLSKEGKYICGGGNEGQEEGNNALFLPSSITPNPIIAQDDDYRYRFIVANLWGFRTGFKIFAPGISIPELKVFEDLENSSLKFSFSTSGKWEAVEFATGITFQGLTINGNSISQNQISENSTLSIQGNEITLNPITNSNFKSSLRRGWNTAKIQIIINKKNNLPAEIVQKEISFYWLPSTFSPLSETPNFDDYVLNNSQNNKMDYVYKPIAVEGRGVFIGDKNPIFISNYGTLTLKQGSNFINQSSDNQGLSNIRFEKEGNIIIEQGAYLCIKLVEDKINNRYTLPDLTTNFILKEGYKLGLSPTITSLSSLPTGVQGNCKSACEFLSGNAPNVVFVDSIDFNSGPNFIVKLNTKGTTYYNQVKFEVSKIISNTQTTNYAVAVVNLLSESVNLKQLLNYNFESCSEYNITMSIGCNGSNGSNNVEWIKSLTKKISTRPIVDAGKDEVVCETIPVISMSSFKPTNGTWNGQGILNGTANFYTANVAKDLNIPLTYSYTDSWGCTTTDEKIVAVRKTPLAPILTSNTPICAKNTVTLSVDSISNASYIWQGANNINITTSKPFFNILQAQPAMSGTYSVQYEIDGCKGISTTKQIIIHPLPTVTAGNDTLLCKMSNSIWLTTGMPRGSVAYWHGKGVGNFDFNPMLAGVGVHPITYVYSDTNGCTNSAVRNITVGPVLTSIDESVCANNAPFTLGGVTPTGGTWSGTAVTSNGVFTPANSPIGTQYLTYTATANGCSNSIQKEVTVKPTPAVPYVSIQPREQACEGGSVTIGVSTVIPGNTYKITGPNGFVAERASASVYNLTIAQQGLYTITASKDGCTNNPNANATRNLFVNPLPTVNAGIDEITCTYNPKLILRNVAPVGGSWSGEGYKKDTISTNTGTDDPPAHGPPPFSSGGAPPPPPIKLSQDVFVPNGLTQGKAYTLTYTFNNPTTGCSNSDTKDIMIGGNPTVRIESSNNDTTCGNIQAFTDLAAIAENSFEYRYQWYKNGYPINGATSAVIRVTEPARYSCVVNASCGQGYADYEVKKCILSWEKVSAGGFNALGIKTSGTLWAWGSNLYGSLGDGTYINRATPTQIGNDKNWESISCGSSVTMGRKKDGSLWYWGSTRNNTEINLPNIPTKIDGADHSIDYCATDRKVFYIKTDGTLWGMGYSYMGSLGYEGLLYGEHVNEFIPILPAKRFKKINASGLATFAIADDGSLWSWGTNTYAQLGQPSMELTFRIPPNQVGTDTDWKDVKCGIEHTLALKQDGTLWAVGSNLAGELGIGNTITSSNTFVKVGLKNNWVKISTNTHTLALDSNEDLYAWGNNRYGKIGISNNVSDNVYEPTKIVLTKPKDFSVGYTTSFVANVDQENLCYVGYSSAGSLGDGDLSNHIVNYWSCLSTNQVRESYYGSKTFEPPIKDFSNLFQLNTHFLGYPTPNPANLFTKIAYQIASGEKASIVIHDMVKYDPLLIIEAPVNNYKVNILQIDTEKLISGVYTYSLVVDEKIVETKKLFIIK